MGGSEITVAVRGRSSEASRLLWAEQCYITQPACSTQHHSDATLLGIQHATGSTRTQAILSVFTLTPPLSVSLHLPSFPRIFHWDEVGLHWLDHHLLLCPCAHALHPQIKVKNRLKCDFNFWRKGQIWQIVCHYFPPLRSAVRFSPT